jgi:arylsulfatase A-like enzyme
MSMSNLRRRDFLSLAAAAPALAQPARPNIVFILADDLGIGDLGCYGGQRIETPNIDRLARDGTRFTDAYAGASVCAPCRSCLMTGQHTGHTRVRDNHTPLTGDGRMPLFPEDVTVAQVLKQAGYATGIFGKWGIGEPGTTGTPNRKGFDDWFGFLNQDHAEDYYTDYLWRNESKETIKGNLNGGRREYAQDLFTREALRFLRAHRSHPFFLYLAYTTPHAKHEVPSLEPYESKPWTVEQKTYAAMVTRLDRDVGRVMAAIKELGLDGNTLVIFASDNGAPAKLDPKFFQGTLHFRESKGSAYEGGTRVPAIARWPGKVPAGRTSSFPWAFWDFLPTAAELAGAKAPPEIDGISIVPTLFGRQQPEHEYLYWEAHRKPGFRQAIRMGKWKGVRMGLAGKLELYDLAGDPSEKTDVASAHPDIVARMESRLKTVRTDTAYYPIEAKPKKAK